MSQKIRTVRIGSRESRLAVIQAQIVADAIKRFDPSIVTKLVTMKTSGDIFLDRSLDGIGGKELFTKEIETALLDGKIDIAVHSFKDMPMEIMNELPVVAVSEREDPRDALVLPQGIRDASKPYGCSSIRRKIQLAALQQDVTVAPIRGNVITRLEKLDSGKYSALVLAAAGLKRMGLSGRISRYFSVGEIIPAACQGILAVQSRKGENTDYLELFHCAESFDRSRAERKFVETLDGGCSSPVAAYAEIDGNEIKISGLYFDEKTSEVRKDIICGDRADGEKLGFLLAEKLKCGNAQVEEV